MKSLKVQGKCNYYLSPVIKGEPPYQSATLLIHAFTNESRKVPLKTSIRYFRVKNKTAVPIANPMNPSIFHFSIDEVGHTIRAEVSPLDNKVFSGVMEVLYGPVELDPSLKYTMENILNSGCSKFRVKDQKNNDYTIVVLQDSIQLSSDKSQTCQFKFGLDNPRLEIQRDEAWSFVLSFDQDCDNFPQIQSFFSITENRFSLTFTANSRNSRDLIVGIVRNFAVRKFLANSMTFDYFSSGISVDSLNFELELDKLKREIHGLTNKISTLTVEKFELSQENSALENELKKSVENYSNIINELKNKGTHTTLNESLLDVSMFGKRENIEIVRKSKILERENEVLRENVTNLKNQIEFLENFNKNRGFFDESRDDFKEDPKSVLNDLQKKLDESKKLNKVLLQEIADGKNESQSAKDLEILELKKKINQISQDLQEAEINRKSVKSSGSLEDKIQEKELEIKELRGKLEETRGENEKIRFLSAENTRKMRIEMEGLKERLNKPSLGSPPINPKTLGNVPLEISPMNPITFGNVPLEIKALRSEIDTLKSENEAFQRENFDLLSDRKRKIDRIIELERENRILNKTPDLSSVMKENQALKTEVQRFSEEKKSFMKEKDELKDQFDDLKFKYNAVSSELRVLKAHKAGSEKADLTIEAVLRENMSLRADLDQQRLFIENNSKKIIYEGNNEAIKGWETRVESLENEKRALINKIESMNRELIKIQRNGGDFEKESLRRRVFELEGEIQIMMTEKKSRNQAKSGNKGIFN